MKFNFKALVAAAALAVTGSAFAAIDTSANPDLLFVAWDANGSGATYVRDLGSLSTLGTNATSNVTFSAPTGSIFSTQFASVASSNIAWGVFAVYNSPAADSSVVYQTNSLANLQGFDDTNVAGVVSTITGSSNSLPQLDLAANGYAKANGEYTGSTTPSDQTNGIVIAAQFSFGKPQAAQGVGTSQNFLKIVQNVDPTTGLGTGDPSQLDVNSALSAFDSVNNANAKGGYFTLTDALGDLTWTGSAAVAAVPVPAAALLFAPGLLAMVGVGRRRNRTAA